MTPFQRLLLAGTILPALVALPILGASAQAPDQGERPPHRQHPEGGKPKGEGGAEAPRAQRQGGGEERRPGAGERGGAPGRENAQGAGAGEQRRARQQGNDADRPNRGEAQHAEEPRRGGRPNEGAKAMQPEDARPANRGPAGDARPAHRDAERDRDGAGAPRGAAPPAARDNPTRADERENRGNANRAGAPDRQDRAGDRGPGDRMRDPDRRDDRRFGNDERRGPGPGPGGGRPGPGPGAPGGGFGGGFLPPTQARGIDDLRRDRREVREGDRTFIREPGRTIVEERGRAFIVHDETDRFRALGLDVRRERRGADFIDVTTRPNGDQILTFTDPSGRMLRRVRRTRDGREIVLIDNSVGGRIGGYEEDIVVLPPPPLRIPRDRYIVDYRDANPGVIYDTLIAPPLVAPPRRYTLDQIRYSPDVRSYVRSVDINTINFDSGSWEVPAAATGKLEALGTAINRALDRNSNSVFLIEGYTDATGNANDNLSLSDRRAQSVAEILTKDFRVPPENLTTQGYGQQNPREDTAGPSAANRRVVVRNITQLLAEGGEPAR